jgi:hypothetical protein
VIVYDFNQNKLASDLCNEWRRQVVWLSRAWPRLALPGPAAMAFEDCLPETLLQDIAVLAPLEELQHLDWALAQLEKRCADRSVIAEAAVARAAVLAVKLSVWRLETLAPG